MIPSSSISSFPRPAPAPSREASADSSPDAGRSSVDSAKGHQRDFDDLIDRNNRGPGHSAKQNDKQTLKQTDKPAEHAEETKDTSSDTASTAADTAQQTAQTAAQLAAQQAADQAAQQAPQTPWQSFRLTLANATADTSKSATGTETGVAGQSPVSASPQDLHPQAGLGGPQSLLTGKAAPQAGQPGKQVPVSTDPSASLETPATAAKENANPAAAKLPASAQPPVAEQPETGAAVLAGQTALPSQLLKSEREANADQTVDVASGVGEVAVTTVRAASPKEMPAAASKDEPSTKTALADLPVQNGVKISNPKEAGQNPGGGGGRNSEQESVSGEVSKTTAVAPHTPEIASSFSASPAALGATGAASATGRISEVGAAGRVDPAPVMGKIWEAAEAMSSSQPGRVDLVIPMSDNENVKIRVELRSGEIHATIQTDSPELREALQKSWPDFAVQTSERGLKLADASFSPAQQDGSGGQNGAGSQREQQLEQQSEGQQNAGQGRPGGGLSAGAGRQPQGGSIRTAPAVQAPAPAGPVTLWA